MAKENLSAPGHVADWIDATQIALDSGDFTRIKLSRKGDEMTARYGADTLSIIFGAKDQEHVILKIDCEEQAVIDWYKACVTDVVKHPEKYEDYYADDAESDEAQKEEGVGETPITIPESVKEKLPAVTGGGRLKGLLPKTWFMVLMLVLLPPFGLFLLYRYHQAMGFKNKLLITIIALFYTLFIWLGFFGIDTGFSASTVTGWFSGLQKTTQQQVQNVVATPTPTPTVQVNPD